MPACLLTHVPVVVICVCNMPLKGVDDLVWIDGMEGDPLTPSCHSATDQNKDLIHRIREHQPFTTPDSCENEKYIPIYISQGKIEKAKV